MDNQRPIGTMIRHEAENDKSKVEQIDSDKAPYVVLVGNVGSGKSTIVEKLTGEKGRSSSSAESATRATEYFWTPDQRLLIADTPGTNPRKDKLEHNNEIAAALSYREVSKFLIVAKAHVRMDQTISEIKQYSDRFVELPDDLVGVMVTHMDINKEWDEREIKEVLYERFEISDVIFSGSHKIADEVNRRIIDTCQTSYRIDVGCRLYNELFRTEESNIKILKITNEIVRRFEQIRKDFVKKLALCSQLDRANAIFEFLTFFKEKQLETGKAEMICNLKFNFKGENGDLQKGFLINMENQANAVMSDLRKEAAFYQLEATSAVRRCPFCGTAWENPNITKCKKDKTTSDLDTKMANFVFGMSENGLVFNKKIASPGCGKVITWNEMCPANITFATFEPPTSQTKEVEETSNETDSKSIHSNQANQEDTNGKGKSSTFESPIRTDSNEEKELGAANSNTRSLSSNQTN
eukprot:TCONS_00069223-protein